MHFSRFAIDRRGVSLLELLVCVGLVGMLAGLILPAVAASRGAARRIQCAYNLRQIGVALHSYVTDWEGFPPLTSWGQLPKMPTVVKRGHGYSNQSLLLSYIDYPTFNSINFQSYALPKDLSPDNSTAASTRIATFLCPDDIMVNGGPYAPNNYRANAGLCDGCAEQNQGAFVWPRLGTLAGFIDGLSNTMAYSEKLLGSGRHNRYQSRRDWVFVFETQYTIDYHTWIVKCSQLDPSLVASNSRLDAGGTWLLGGAVNTSFFCSVLPNSPVPDCGMTTYNGLGVFGARSNHPEGVNVLMADGSTTWVSSGIDLKVWHAKGTRANMDR